MRVSLLLAALAWLAGCGLASVDIKLTPDGAGEVELVTMEGDAAPLAAIPGVTGVKKAESIRMAIAGETYAFADVRKFKMDGVGLKWTPPRQGTITVAVTLDTRVSAFWFRRLGLTPEKVAAAAERSRRFVEVFMKQAGEMAMFAGGDRNTMASDMASVITVDVVLKGAKDAKVELKRPARLPAGWSLETPEGGKARLKIPVADIFASTVPEVALVVTATAKPPSPPTKPAR
jgi:hypothetical protein